MPSARPLASMLACLFLLAPALTGAQGADYIREHYDKREVRIPMRDGVKLFTAIYTPKDGSHPYPIVMERTPYSVGPYGEDKFPRQFMDSSHYAEDGYIFVRQDVRGRFMSEGEYVNVRPEHAGPHATGQIDESTDTYDTIDWLIKNVPNNNGRVGMWGISYPGFYAACGAIDSHPALKAVSPQAPVSDWFIGDDFHHNGAFFLIDALPFFAFFGKPRPKPTTEWSPGLNIPTMDMYDWYLSLGPLKTVDEKYLHHEVGFWDELMQHGTYDAYWKARRLEPNLRDIHCAVMTVGGWYDAEDMYGALHVHEAIQKQDPGTPNMLVMGPWVHGGWAGGAGDRLGDITFGDPTGPYFRDNVERPFFNYYLKDGGAAPQPRVLAFQTGSNRWLRLDSWPPRNVTSRSLYLGIAGQLNTGPPAGAGPAFDEYLSDPDKPVPYTALATQPERSRHVNQYLIEDQRFAAHRPDVLVYQTGPLDSDLSIAGPIPVDLYVSSTGTDADFVVKVIDVWPGAAPEAETPERRQLLSGYEELVRADVMRAKFRNSFEHPEPLKPGQVTPVRFTLQDACHTFKKGHRIMVQVQSSWFPLVDRNPQKFVDIYHASAADFHKATQRVYHDSAHPSHITLSVLP